MLSQKPSNKIQRRYILFSIKDKGKINSILADYLGILGLAKASPMFVEDNILAINSKEIDAIRAAIELSSENIRILKVSGTLKGLGK